MGQDANALASLPISITVAPLPAIELWQTHVGRRLSFWQEPLNGIEVRPEPARSITTCRVSFFDPSRFKGRLSTSLAGNGFDRLNVGRTTTLLKGAPAVVAAMEPLPATTLVIA